MAFLARHLKRRQYIFLTLSTYFTVHQYYGDYWAMECAYLSLQDLVLYLTVNNRKSLQQERSSRYMCTLLP